jgi:DNA-binding NarL/FixJ family response regulator
VNLVRAQRPHVLVLDLAMPRVLDALRQLRNGETGVRVVVVVAAIRSQAAVAALTLGARGVLRKNVRPSVLSECVRAVAHGGYWISEGRVEDMVDAFDRVRVGTSPLSGSAPRCQSGADVVPRRQAGFRGASPATSSTWRRNVEGESGSL